MLGITQSEQLNSEFKKLLTQHINDQSIPPILLLIHPTYNKRHGKVLFSSLSPLKLQGLER